MSMLSSRVRSAGTRGLLTLYKNERTLLLCFIFGQQFLDRDACFDGAVEHAGVSMTVRLAYKH